MPVLRRPWGGRFRRSGELTDARTRASDALKEPQPEQTRARQRECCDLGRRDHRGSVCVVYLAVKSGAVDDTIAASDMRRAEQSD